MSGKYARKEPEQGKKKSIVIIVLICLFLIFGGITVYVISQNISSDTNNTKNTELSAIQSETYISEETPSTVINNTIPTDTTIESTLSTPEETTENIVVPNLENADESLNFNAEFAAYKAYDKTEERRVSLKEVFGSSYSGGTFVFKETGTFEDNLSISSKNYGAYAVIDDIIYLTYANDKNSTAEIISQDDYYTPTEIMMNYGGYEVYFKN